MPRNLRQRVVVITGASSGIGRACALEFARLGCRLVVAARRHERLAALRREVEARGAKCLDVPTDVTVADQLERLLGATLERFGRVDIWINNAGFGLLGRFDQTTEEEMRRLMETNFMAAFNGTRLALAQMRRQESGHIVNVSSLGGVLPVPLCAAYSASKFALTAMTEALDMELHGSGIRASIILPSFTRTEFTDAMVRKLPARNESKVRQHSAEHVARRIVACARRPVPRVSFAPVPPLTMAFFALFPSVWRWLGRQWVRDRTM
jgi:short-subunit dehydrogenase